MAELPFQLLLFVFVLISCSMGFDPSIPRSQDDIIEERECVGTGNGFSISGTSHFRYDLLQKRYMGCTYVLGNLEITHLVDPSIKYDLSFLKHIRYVSGYVLIGLSGEVNDIPLLSLEVIRGNQTFKFQGKEYSLMVALTSRDLEGSPANGLKTLMMPKLKEISHGKAIFIQNPSLGYIDTIDWDSIMKEREDAVHFGQEAYNQTESNVTDPDLCNGGGMWGNDKSLCQEVVSQPLCDEKCDRLCFGPGPDQCCHDTCAVGCKGPTEKQCMICKDFLYEDRCVSYCPALSYQLMQDCIKYTPLNGI